MKIIPKPNGSVCAPYLLSLAPLGIVCLLPLLPFYQVLCTLIGFPLRSLFSCLSLFSSKRHSSSLIILMALTWINSPRCIFLVLGSPGGDQIRPHQCWTLRKDHLPWPAGSIPKGSQGTTGCSWFKGTWLTRVQLGCPWAFSGKMLSSWWRSASYPKCMCCFPETVWVLAGRRTSGLLGLLSQRRGSAVGQRHCRSCQTSRIRAAGTGSVIPRRLTEVLLIC